MAILDRIIEFESELMEEEEVTSFFQELIDTGTINHLQGSYQRIAMDLIRSGNCELR